MKRNVLLLGNPDLYKICTPVQKEELSALYTVVEDLHDTLFAYKVLHNAGRAIAAPQIGVQKRLVYMYIDKPVAFINPCIEFTDNEMMTVMDDCMSFPGLLVKVYRHKRCKIHYFDMDWKECSLGLEGGLSELLQHECDHLDGILATMRAIDNRSFYIKDEPEVPA